MYFYEDCKVTKIHDGDTITADLYLGFGVWKLAEKFRLFGPDADVAMGMNAPELNTPEGVLAQKYLEELISKSNYLVTIRTPQDRQEKYGRFLAVVYGTLDARKVRHNFNQMMIDAGHASLRQYDMFRGVNLPPVIGPLTSAAPLDQAALGIVSPIEEKEKAQTVRMGTVRTVDVEPADGWTEKPVVHEEINPFRDKKVIINPPVLAEKSTHGSDKYRCGNKLANIPQYICTKTAGHIGACAFEVDPNFKP